MEGAALPEREVGAYMMGKEAVVDIDGLSAGSMKDADAEADDIGCCEGK